MISPKRLEEIKSRVVPNPYVEELISGIEDLHQLYNAVSHYFLLNGVPSNSPQYPIEEARRKLWNTFQDINNREI